MPVVQTWETTAAFEEEEDQLAETAYGNIMTGCLQCWLAEAFTALQMGADKSQLEAT